jgi:hypothetical protein
LQRAAVPGILAVLVPAQRLLAESILGALTKSEMPPGSDVFSAIRSEFLAIS